MPVVMRTHQSACLHTLTLVPATVSGRATLALCSRLHLADWARRLEWLTSATSSERDILMRTLTGVRSTRSGKFAQRLELAKLFLAALGVIGGGTGAITAYCDHIRRIEIEGQERQARSDQELRQATLDALHAVHELKAKTCIAACDAAARIVDASTAVEFEGARQDFARVKHGQGLALLDRAVLDSMIVVHNAAIDVDPDQLPPATSEPLRRDIRCKVGSTVFELAHRCRDMISQDYQDQIATVVTIPENLKGIEILDKRYGMGWLSTSCPTTNAGIGTPSNGQLAGR
jgi:hypothetical protein